MFASEGDSAVCQGEISKVPLCSRKKLTNTAFTRAKQKYCLSGPVKILSKGLKSASSKTREHLLHEQTTTHTSRQALKGHDAFAYLK